MNAERVATRIERLIVEHLLSPHDPKLKQQQLADARKALVEALSDPGQSLADELAEFQKALTRLEVVVGQLPDRPESEIPI